MKQGKKISIFADSDNFLNMLGNIFYEEEFKRTDYLPPNADWKNFFTLVAKSFGSESLNVFWYSIKDFDFFPEGDWQSMPFEEAEAKLKRISGASQKLKDLTTEKDRMAVVNEFRYIILKNRKRMEARLARRRDMEKKLSKQFSAINIRTPGWQSCSLVDMSALPARATKGGIITDLFTQSDNYDFALLISGDCEFVPAVKALSKQGKQFACFNFPAPAPRKPARISRKLVDCMDYVIDIPLDDMAEFMGIKLRKEA